MWSMYFLLSPTHFCALNATRQFFWLTQILTAAVLVAGGPLCLISQTVCLVHWLYNCVPHHPPPPHLFPTFYNHSHWILFLINSSIYVILHIGGGRKNLRNVTKRNYEALENKGVLGPGYGRIVSFAWSCCIIFLLFLHLFVSCIYSWHGYICPWLRLFMVALVPGFICSWLRLFMVAFVYGCICSWLHLFICCILLLFCFVSYLRSINFDKILSTFTWGEFKTFTFGLVYRLEDDLLIRSLFKTLLLNRSPPGHRRRLLTIPALD